MSNGRPLSSKERKELAKKRKESAKQAQNYHKQQRRLEKSSAQKRKPDGKKQAGKIEQLIKSESKKPNEYKKMSREEKFIRESDEKIRNLEPHDHEDGYYIDEYAARQKQKKRAKIIRKQENEVIRRNKKPLTQAQIRRRRILISAGLGVLVLVIGVILSLTVLFKTEKIEIEGDDYYYDDQIIAFSNVTLQQNIFIAAMNSTSQEIVENLPYVEKAEIGFSIPDTITIKITNATPSYVIPDGNNFLLVSSKGRILAALTENKDNLPLLTCGELTEKTIGKSVSFSDSNVPDILLDVAQSLQDNEVDKITAFDVTDTSNITLTYDDRIKINIGLPEDVDYKIRTAMKIITEKLDPNNTGTITGTLDVSSCNTTKMSHYKPGETLPSPTGSTDPTATTASEDGTQSYTWSQDNSGTGYGDTTGGDSYGNGDYSYGGDTYSYGSGDTGSQTYGGDQAGGDLYGGQSYGDYSGGAENAAPVEGQY